MKGLKRKTMTVFISFLLIQYNKMDQHLPFEQLYKIQYGKSNVRTRVQSHLETIELL